MLLLKKAFSNPVFNTFVQNVWIMDDNKVSALLVKLEKCRKTMETNQKASKEFLIKVGVVTKKGDLRANYKHLWLPLEQI